MIMQISTDNKDKQKNDAWSKHARIVRGNPVRVYEGDDFRLR